MKTYVLGLSVALLVPVVSKADIVKTIDIGPAWSAGQSGVAIGRR
jgi:hypothetical protein